MPLFCLHAEFSSDVDHHNSITSKPASRQSHMVKKLGDLPKFFVFNSGTKSFSFPYLLYEHLIGG
jgi:hypothetical protein